MDGPDPSRERVVKGAPSTAAAVVVLVAVLAAFVATRSFDAERYNHDIGWLLHGAARILDGARYHEDWVEVSPPAIVWLTMVPAVAARALGAPARLVYDLFVLALVLVAAVGCDRILRSTPGEAAAGFRRVVTASVIAGLVLLPGFDLGQREHLLVILTLPYLFAAAAARAGWRVSRPLALAVGVLAAAGFALKPHFLVLWIAVEVWLRRGATPRSWVRIENAVIVGGQLVHGAAVLVLTPEYRTIAERALEVYGAYDVNLSVFIFSPAAGALAAGALLFALVRPTTLNRELRAVLLLASAVLFAIALLQGKGFSYHLSAPLVAAALLAVVVLAGLLAEERAVGALVRPAVARLPLVALSLLIAASGVRLADAVNDAWGAGRSEPSLVRTLAGAVAQEAAGREVLALSTSIPPLFPAVELGGARWSSRFGCLWILPGLYSAEEKARRPFPYHAPEKAPDTERYLLDAVVADLSEREPALIVVDGAPVKQGFGPAPTAFDFLEYFSRDPRFAEAFAAYRHVGDIGPYRFYRRGPD